MSKNYRAVLCLLTGVFFWSVNAAVARAYAAEIPPVVMSIFRWAGAGIIITAVMYRDIPAAWVYLKKHPYSISVLALLSVTIYNTLQYKAAQTTLSVNINLINTMGPPITMALAFIINKQKMTAGGIFGIFLAFSGTLVVVFKGSIENALRLDFNAGDLLMLLAIALWGVYSVLINRFKPALKQTSLLMVMIWVGFLVLLPLYALPGIGREYRFRAEHIAVFAFLWIFPSILSLLLWNYGVSVLGAGKAAFSLYIAPVYGTLIGIFVMNEAVAWYHPTAMVMILTGFYLNFRKSHAARLVAQKQ